MRCCLVLSLFFPGLFLAAHAAEPGAAPVAHAAPRYAHVVVVIEENKSFATIIGSQQAPYINHLAQHGLLFTDAHGVTHPSQPNYIALFSGSTQGVKDDSCPHDFSGPNLAEGMLARKLSFVIYSEAMPEAGFSGCGSEDRLYRRKHNPVADWQAVLPAAVNQPFSAFPQDYSRLPALAFVVPNMMNDMHDGSIGEGDSWLKQHLDAYVRWAGSHDSLLIVTWDESDARSSSNRIPMIALGANIKPGSSAQYLTHYNLLRTLADMYGLKPMGNAETAEPIHGIGHRMKLSHP
ncbi:MAG TPA: alkaline phosphatase family protein [Gammaproteobacteria bacterium]|nr:alkaline phosphatase family protein [Gammaproteobacteria bacterium]